MTEFFNLAAEAFHLVLLLETALEGTLPILEQSSFSLGKISSLDLALDFGQFQRR